MDNKVFILIFVAAVFIVGGVLYVYNPEPVEYGDIPQEDGQVVCTLDALLCPDGSYVGRVPPYCQFAACPIPKDAVFEDGTLPENEHRE